MIDILPTAEQAEFVGGVANAIGKSDAAVASDPWAFFAELGCIGMALDEDVGGAGFTIADEVLVHQELGRQLASPNVLAAALAARLAADAHDTDLAGRIVDGSQPVAFASPLGGKVTEGGLKGDFHLLSADESALVICVGPDGAALAQGAAFAERSSVQSTDEAIELVRVSGQAPAIHWTGDNDQRLWRRANLLVAAQLAGIAETTQNRAVEYAKVREQFGKPIGAFQAIGHHCANMAVRTEAASAQLYFAAIALRDEAPDAAFQVAAACSVAMDAAFQNATMAIQVHGGMGFSAESGLHRFLKRAVMLRHLIGGEHAQELAVFNAYRAA
ncbi:MAG TPA: acyl-CoA dehydrogenase family protein [Caulobacteraceae bacterium]|nr:acyl-CoA dehydrogenase family protein [Caulobacteraceae bacterium]